MNFEKIKVLGIMSGTSLDGIDFAVIEFQLINNKWAFEILQNHTYVYSEEWFERLKNAVYNSKTELELLNFDYTQFLNKLIHQFISDYKINDLHAIASHGHTILHNPQEGYTLQIGNLPMLKNGFSIPLVCDFRVQDVQLGGQGAPLVPIGDRLLFADFDFCLNLGGFSNISFEHENKRIAYDISPVNTVLNFYVNKLGFDFDDDGKIARSGIVNHHLLEKLNKHDFYQRNFPKSLGIEFVLTEVLPIIDQFKLAEKDVLATYVDHIAIQVSNQLKNKKGKLIITGGGTFNSYLIEKLIKYNPTIEIIIPNKTIINYKEALIFAFLGLLKLKGINNVLSSVTGAKTDHSSGVVF